MMDNAHLGGVLKHASRAGAKVILIGDDRQLASIERGGMFTAIREKHGASELRHLPKAARRNRPEAIPVILFAQLAVDLPGDPRRAMIAPCHNMTQYF